MGRRYFSFKVENLFFFSATLHSAERQAPRKKASSVSHGATGGRKFSSPFLNPFSETFRISESFLFNLTFFFQKREILLFPDLKNANPSRIEFGHNLAGKKTCDDRD
jgi:hypothetical protein